MVKTEVYNTVCSFRNHTVVRYYTQLYRNSAAAAMIHRNAELLVHTRDFIHKN